MMKVVLSCSTISFKMLDDKFTSLLIEADKLLVSV